MAAERQPASGPMPSDEELIRQLAAQQQSALLPLYSRYAPLVFHMAAQSLGASAADDIVQDVFVSVWHKAGTFDPRRGAVRPWLLQIAHYRILNELRRRTRHPQLDPDDDGEWEESVPDGGREPFDAVWQSYRRDAVRAAVEKLPPTQRQALSLAFFEDLTHDQVANLLDLPVGTVKTRIRTALQTLRLHMAALLLALVMAGGAAAAGMGYLAQQSTVQRDMRALLVVTSSETTSLHLGAAPGINAATHGSYRARTGTPLAVVSIDDFAPAPTGRSYQVWAHIDGTWHALGIIVPNPDGTGVLIAEDAALATLPDRVEITLELAGGSAAPGGPLVVLYPNP